MDNKKILSKLFKIASNQQTVLNKLAQMHDAGAAANNEMRDFVKYQFTSWAMPKEVQAKLSFTIEVVNKQFDVAISLTLSSPEQKNLVLDPTNGLAAHLNNKFATASQSERWKDLAGYQATFNVTTN